MGHFSDKNCFGGEYVQHLGMACGRGLCWGRAAAASLWNVLILSSSSWSPSPLLSHLYPNLAFHHGFDSFCFWEKGHFMNYFSSWDFSLLCAEMWDWFRECRFFCLKLYFMCGPIPCGLVRGFDKGGKNWGQRTQTDFFVFVFEFLWSWNTDCWRRVHL